MLKSILYGIIAWLVLAGIMLLFYINDFANEIDYYENGIRIDAIKYHNEIYLKKGE